jgi:hypothetical protein
LHDNVADREFCAGAENPPVTMSIQQAVATNRFGGERVAINRHVKFAAKNFQAANMIAVLVREQDAIELAERHAALFETQDDLPRAQSTIDKNLAMIGRDEGAVSGAAAPEHRQTEHASI